MGDPWKNLSYEDKGKLVLLKELAQTYGDITTKQIAEKLAISPDNTSSSIGRILEFMEYKKLGVYALPGEALILINEYEEEIVSNYRNLPKEKKAILKQIIERIEKEENRIIKATDLAGILNVQVVEVTSKLKRLGLIEKGLIIKPTYSTYSVSDRLVEKLEETAEQEKKKK